MRATRSLHGEVPVVAGAHALSCRWSGISAHQSAQERGGVVAVFLHHRAGPVGAAREDGADEARRAGGRSARCWRPSTGIASSISCSVACTEVTASTSPRGPGQRRDASGGTVSRPAGAAAGLRAAATAACASSSWARAVVARAARARRGGRRPARRCGGSPARRASPRRRSGEVRAAARADGRPRLEGHHGAPAATPGGLDQSGLAQGGHRLAQGRPRDLEPGRRARARRAASSRAGRPRAGSPSPSCSTHASKAWWPRTGRSTASVRCVRRVAAVMRVILGSPQPGVNREWSEFRPILRYGLFTPRSERV